MRRRPIWCATMMAHGQTFTRRLRAMGIRDRPISPRSPWQNPYAERLIGTLRRVSSSTERLSLSRDSAADPPR
jgi:hypothetical protein